MYGDFMASTEEDCRALFVVKLFSVVFLTQKVLPIMLNQGRGVILNVASIGGLMAHSDKVTPYVSSKHAVVGFSRGLAEDMDGKGIHILAVCPHLTATEFFSVSPGAEAMAPVVEKYRDFMDTPEEVALGIIRQLDSKRVVVFPTDKPARAYEKQRDNEA
jgi:short-subunit dehydrogenase